MADRYRAPGGWTVEVVQLEVGERLRVRQYGYYVADVRTVAELERWFPLDGLEPYGLSLHLGRAQTRPSPWTG